MGTKIVMQNYGEKIIKLDECEGRGGGGGNENKIK